MDEKQDYTVIRDERIRGKICELMSEMLDNPDEYGLFPTSRFMWKMETFILEERKQIEAEKDEPIWPVQVRCGPKAGHSFWLTTGSLQRLVTPRPGSAPPPAADYKQDVLAYEAANRSGKVILVGAWASEHGTITCDWIQYQPKEGERTIEYVRG